MFDVFRRILLLAAVLLGLVSPALADRRVALVIGNSNYNVGGQLANTVNDANLVQTALKAALFDTVEVRTDLSIAGFRKALRQFQTLAKGADVALIYYAGHGIEARGSNWLIPTDAELKDTGDLEFEAIKLDLALQTLDASKMRILLLDACRNNPFGRSWGTGQRAIERGLKSQEVDGVLVLYAAAPGQVASDGPGLPNGPFASALAKRLPEAGLPVQLMGGLVRDDVMDATGGNQRPYISASITGKPFYLVPAIAAAAPPIAPPTAVVPVPEPTVLSDPTFAKALQTELRRLQCYQGEPDGIWGAKSTYSLSQARLKLSLADDGRSPNSLDLAALKRTSAPLCPPTCASGFEAKSGTCVPLPCPSKAKRNSDGDCEVAPPAPEVIIKKKPEKATPPPVKDTPTIPPKEKIVKTPTKERESLPWCTESYAGVDRCRRRSSGEVCDRFGSAGWRCKPG